MNAEYRMNIFFKQAIYFLGLKFEATQYRWGRKLFAGKWYYSHPQGLPMAAFWTEQEITSCQSITLDTEEW